MTDGSQIRLLIVDDSPDLGLMLRVLLETQPDMTVCAVLERADDMGKVALAEGANLVLLDLTMPGKDPLESIRDLPETTRVVVFSGYDDPQTVASALESGAHGFLKKGAQLEEMLDVLRRVAAGAT